MKNETIAALTLLAANAAFVRAHGRKVIFQPPAGPAVSFDVAQIHPNALRHLGVDAAVAIARSEEAEKAKADRALAARKMKQAQTEIAERIAKDRHVQRLARLEAEIQSQEQETEMLTFAAMDRENAAINYSRATATVRNQARRDDIGAWIARDIMVANPSA